MVEELTAKFIDFYRSYYEDEIGQLAQRYPNERRSLHIDYDDLYQFDSELAEDYRSQPDQLREYAEEALRRYDPPADVKLNAHVRVENLPETIESIRVQSGNIGKLVAVEGIVAEAADEDVQMTDSAFECQRCGTRNYIPQSGGELQEPNECQGCERQGPFRISFDQSEFIDSQQFRLRSTETDVSDGEKPIEITVNLKDDIVGVTAGDYVKVNGVLHVEQEDSGSSKFKPYLDAVSITTVESSPPSFTSDGIATIGMSEFLNVASDTLASLPDTAREPGTKSKLITPFIEALGWNKFDNDEWRFEYTDSKTTKRVDYALFDSDSESPDIVVEAKQLGKRLDDYESQIYDYLRIFSAEYGILTNGEYYRIYHNPPEDEPTKLTELGLHDVPDAAIIDELQPSAASTTPTAADAGRSQTETDTGAQDTGVSFESEASSSTSTATIEIDSDSEDCIIDLIDRIDDNDRDGVSIERVIEIAVENGIDESTVRDTIDKHRRKGEIYEPTNDHLRNS